MSDMPDPPSIEKQPAINLSTFSPEILNELQFMLKDALAGDESVLSRPEYSALNMEQIKAALEFVLSSNDLSDAQREDLLSNSWRLNYRDHPPSPEEFLTEKYLGPTATTIFPWVREAFLEYWNPMKPYRTMVLYPFIGFGKALENTERVYTPKGYKQIGDMLVGDEVCTPDGSVAKITGVFPQGVRPLYRVTFSDGRSVIADEDHLWKAAKTKNGIIWDKEKRKYEKTSRQVPCWKVITTKDIAASMNENAKDRWFIPFPEPISHIENQHVISPYTLGALLGDGHFGTSLFIVGDDVEVHNRVKLELSAGTSVNISSTPSCNYKTVFVSERGPDNIYKIELERLGLRGATSAVKFIPREYLYDSIPNRINLLQGLMDTDGTAHNTSGMAIFSTTSSRLRDDIIELVRGLGGRASFSTYPKEKCMGHANYDQYSVSISFPKNLFPIFSIPRKQARIDAGFSRPRKRSKKQYLYIQSIEKIEDGEATCITIDSPEKLFLTNSYIVTHNSFTAVLINVYIGIHLSMMRNPWKFFGQSPSTVYTQVFVATSQKKSSEILLEPMLQLLESSSFFEKVHSRDSMSKKERDFTRANNIDKIFWTSATPTSALQFSGGANYKLISSPNSLLGQAQPLDEPIKKPDGSYVLMGDLKIGDKIASPSEGETEVVGIFPQGKQKTYKITLEDGRSTRCNASHLWKVGYKKNSNEELITDVVPLQFMLDHPEYEFYVYDEVDCKSPTPNATFKNYGMVFENGVWRENYV